MSLVYAPRPLAAAVIIAGGVSMIRPDLAQTSAGAWATLPPLPTARYGLAAATASDGRIYAIGGLDSTGYYRTVEAYDPSANAWSVVAPLPTPHTDLAAAGSDGRIYAIGGVGNHTPATSPGTDASAKVEAYDPTTNTWSSVAPMPTARSSLAAAVSDGRIYAIGGMDAQDHPLNTVEAYNPSTNTWACSVGDTSSGCSSTTIAPLPMPRVGLAAAGSDGRIYAIGGSDGANALASVEEYNPETNTWSSVAPMPTAREGVAATTGSDGDIYAIGGNVGGGNTAATFLDAVEAFNPASSTWSTVASMPTSRTSFAAATGKDGRIFAVGGYNDSSYGELDTAEVYMPPAWSPPTPGPIPSGPAPTPMPSPAPMPLTRLGPHPTAAQVWKMSLHAMTAVRSLHTQGVFTQGQTATFVGDCSAKGERFRLVVPKQVGVVKKKQQDVIMLYSPNRNLKSVWQRSKIGKASWTAWTEFTSSDELEAATFAYFVFAVYTCPQYLAAPKNSLLRTMRWTVEGSGIVGGTAAWHLHGQPTVPAGLKVDSSRQLGATDLYIAKATLDWVRIKMANPADKQQKALRIDVWYSRFNEPLYIQPPTGATRGSLVGDRDSRRPLERTTRYALGL